MFRLYEYRRIKHLAKLSISLNFAGLEALFAAKQASDPVRVEPWRNKGNAVNEQQWREWA
ncbi:MAG: hypothetical protein V4623_06695 [Pseudomonadota bacterium]